MADEEQKEKHWNDIKDDSYSDEDRTKKFVEHIKTLLVFDNNSASSKILPSELKKLQPSLEELIDYLEKHPDMLKYEFGADGKISKIKVDPSRTFTFFKDSIKRQCNMSYGISEMLKILTLESKSSNEWKSGGNVEVEMSNENYCKGKGITSMAESSTLLNVHESNINGNPSYIPISAGGHKSRRRHRHRRKPARKTRRGRTRIRKSKSKAKSKTHRRKRHSRVRVSKHKKNTYKCRR